MRNCKKLLCLLLVLITILGTFSGCRKQEPTTEPTTEPTEPTTEPIVYSIFYWVNGGLLPYDADLDYTLEDPAELLEPTKENFQFAGWYTNPDFTGHIYVDTVGETGDKNFYAKWIPLEYTITYDLDGGQLVGNVSNPTTYSIDSPEIVLANPTKEGYTFIGWVDMAYMSEENAEATTSATDPTAETQADQFENWAAAPHLKVTIPTGSSGDKSFKAIWLEAKKEAATTGTGNKTTTTGGTASHTHKYKQIKKVEQSCFTEEYTLKKCDCGHVVKDVTKKKLEHEWEAWIIVKEETEEEDGIRKRSCKHCRIVDSEKINNIVAPGEAGAD